MAMMIATNSAIWTQPLIVMAGRSEPFRAHQRPDQVTEQPDGHQAAEDIIQGHWRGSLKPVTEQRVGQAHGEEGQSGGQEDDVEHVDSMRM
jgi:hypothetical protein